MSDTDLQSVLGVCYIQGLFILGYHRVTVQKSPSLTQRLTTRTLFQALET